MRFVSRTQWGARAPRSKSRIGSVYGVTVHWNGPGLGAGGHDTCAGEVRAIQKHHMDDEGWADIGYNALACRHGYVFEGRGLGVLGAHAGESSIGGNAHWYGLQAMVGTGDHTTRELYQALKDAIGWFRRGGAGGKVNGHRDHHPTECPGGELYRWAHSDLTIPDLEDDMPEYVSVGMTKPLDFPPAQWTTLNFDTEYSDSGHNHANAGGASVITGPATYALNCFVQITGLPPGTEGQIRLTRVATGDGGERQPGPIQEFTATSGSQYVLYAVSVDAVGANQKTRVELIHWGETAVKIESAQVKGLAWSI